MVKLKNFHLIRVPVEIDYCRPILGRIYAIYAWFKCIRFLKVKYYTKTFYYLAIPQYVKGVL